MHNKFIYRGHEVNLVGSTEGGFQVLIDGDREDDISGLPFELAIQEARRLIDFHKEKMIEAGGWDVADDKIPF